MKFSLTTNDIFQRGNAFWKNYAAEKKVRILNKFVGKLQI